MTSSIVSLMSSWSLRDGAFLTSADDLASPTAVPDDPAKGLPHLLQFGRLGAKPAPRCIGVGERRGDRLGDFVGDRSRQLAGGRHAIGVGELHLRVAQAGLSPTQFVLGALQVLDVGARCVPFDDFSLRIAERAKAQQKPAIFAVGPPQTRLLLERVPSRERCAPVIHRAVLGCSASIQAQVCPSSRGRPV
jgi:hypothetical protein